MFCCLSNQVKIQFQKVWDGQAHEFLKKSTTDYDHLRNTKEKAGQERSEKGTKSCLGHI